MKLLLSIFLFTALLIRPAAQAEELWLRIGEVRSLAAPKGQGVRVGTRGIVRVIDGATAIQVVGLKTGATTMSVGGRSYSVHVSLNQQKEFAFALRKAVRSMMGLKLQSDTPVLTVTGTLLRWRDWEQLAELSRREQGEYAFAARALPDVAHEAMEHFTQLARDKGIPVAHFRADPIFTVQVPKAVGLKDGALAIFAAYGMRVESNTSNLALQPLIRTRVILAEISKQESRQFGVQWPSEYEAQVLPKFGMGPEALLVSLKALEASGQAQVLASPNLLCRSGSEAKFHAGGEFPIRIISRNTHDVVWKQHGVILNVKPQADYQGAISLELETEVSLLDMSGAVDGIPALKSNTVKSHFDLPGRRTIALSGLLRQDSGENRDGLPFLKNIPVLGNLFSSQSYLKHQSELVIFVTPEIYVPDSDEKIEMPAGWSVQ